MSAALSAYLPTHTAACFSLLSITMSLFTFCVSFTLFRREWRCLFSYPEHIFRGKSGRFLHIAVTSSPNPAVFSSFLYLSIADFSALQELAQETLCRPAFTTNPTIYSTTNLPTHPVVASKTTSANPNRVYPLITALFIKKCLLKIKPITVYFISALLGPIYMYICIRLLDVYIRLHTLYYSSRMKLSDASPRFTYAGLSSFLAGFRVSSIVLRNLFFVVHSRVRALLTISITPGRFRTIILFTYVSVRYFGKYAPSHPQLTSTLTISVFSFRSSCRFLGESSAPTPAVAVVTSSGRVASVAVGDTVLLVEDVRYRVQKLFPVDGTVILQKINSREGPIKRFF